LVAEQREGSPFELLQAASKGDADSYGELFGRYSQKLYNFVYYLTFSREDSEDITSETFIKVYEAIQGRDLASFNFQAYLYKTAKNLSLNSMARRKREGLTMEEAMEIPEPDVAATPETAALISEQRSTVLAVADSLTDDQQTALLLKELEGFPYGTIADVLDSNPNAVGALLSRARLKFREVYRKRL
jgi:RNA polymerase sigma-70 factor (ECF subfamily)